MDAEFWATMSWLFSGTASGFSRLKRSCFLVIVHYVSRFVPAVNATAGGGGSASSAGSSATGRTDPVSKAASQPRKIRGVTTGGRTVAEVEDEDDHRMPDDEPPVALAEVSDLEQKPSAGH